MFHVKQFEKYDLKIYDKGEKVDTQRFVCPLLLWTTAKPVRLGQTEVCPGTDRFFVVHPDVDT